MSTNWKQIRELLTAAVDLCESYESRDFTEEDRTLKLADGAGNLQDLVSSAQSYPERLKYNVIRARHRGGLDNPYVPETARILKACAELAAELIVLNPPAHMRKNLTESPQALAAADEISNQVQELVLWYRKIFLVQIQRLPTKGQSGFLN